MHYHPIDDDGGNLVDLVPLCSDACHRDWCAEHGATYGGWYGCQESDHPEWCANCGVVCNELECGCSTVVVNRVGRDLGEKCDHGNWLQLPAPAAAVSTL